MTPSRCGALRGYNQASPSTESLSRGEQCLPVHQRDFTEDRYEKIMCDFGTGNDFAASMKDLYIANQRQEPTSFVRLAVCAGDLETACIMTVGAAAVDEFHRLAGSSTSIPQARRGDHMGFEAIEKALNPIYFESSTLAPWFRRTALNSSADTSFVSSLMACASAAKVYHLLPGATIATSVLSQTMDKALWVPSNIDADHLDHHTLSRAQTFACIAMFHTGTNNFDPRRLRDVFGLSSGNSMYVAGPLLCDPYENAGETEIRHIVGNIGRHGLSMLVPPPAPRVHKLPPGTWNQLNFLRFDGKPENSFERTSIHLSFTHFQMPLPDDLRDDHIVDRPAQLVETLVSVCDGQR
ncbi:hypothetical protein XPA_010009 [Xanthoria parietina]